MIQRVFLILAITAAVWGSGYFLGRSHAEVKIVKEQVEVIRYVEKKTAQIHSRPNAGRDVLLERMRNGQL